MTVIEEVKGQSCELLPEEQKLLALYFQDVSGDLRQKASFSNLTSGSRTELLQRAFSILERESTKAVRSEHLASDLTHSTEFKSHFSKFSFFNSIQLHSAANPAPEKSEKEIASWVKNLLKKF